MHEELRNPAAPQGDAHQDAFDRWTEHYAADWVRENPQHATVKQYFDGDEQDALDRRLALASAYGGAIGTEAARAQAARAQSGLEALAGFSRARLTPAQRVSASLIERRLADAIASAEFAKHRLVFSQLGGLHVALITFLTTMHPLRDARDAENYVVRLQHVAGLLDRGRTESAAAAAAGIVAPRIILERTIEQLDGLTAGDAASHVLVTSLVQRLTSIRNFAPARVAELAARAAAITGAEIVPALQRVRAELAAQHGRAGDDAGVRRLPDGEAFYAQQLRVLAGSSLTPREIHEIGLREVARIETEMDAIFKQLGYRAGTIPERVEAINATLRRPDEPGVREAIVAELQLIVDDAQVRSAACFNVRPAAPVIIKREPAHTERTAAAHYSTPARDGSQPGIYWIPLGDLGPTVPWLGIGTKSTAYHEAIPGHHFQLAIEQETPALPRFRKRSAFGYDPSFGEGWALYSEHLAAEYDWYEDDLPARLGYLQMQLFRARRLVVDTGLHAFGWTREEAIAYGLHVTEVERYMAWPGQACSYMLGQLRILEIRAQARAVRGDAFSMRAFHDLVLTNGTLPLDVLAQAVATWSAG